MFSRKQHDSCPLVVGKGRKPLGDSSHSTFNLDDEGGNKGGPPPLVRWVGGPPS
jgi:hypothetical protein